LIFPKLWDEEPKISNVVKVFSKQLKIKLNKKSGFVTLRLLWKNPQQGADIINI